MKSPIGLRYLLVEKDQVGEKINFGNTYFLNKSFTRTVQARFNEQQYPVRLLEEPLSIEEGINKGLEANIQSLINKADGNDNINFGAIKAEPISKGPDYPIWAKIHVHYVGQGDTIVLELPGKQLWMIDAYFRTKYRQKHFDDWMEENFPGKKLDRLILSHFHYDHIHSIPYVITRYQPQQVVISDSLIHKTAVTRKALHHANGRLKILKNEETTVLGELSISLYRTDQICSVTGIDPNDHEIVVIIKTNRSFGILAGDTPGTMCNLLLRKQFPCLVDNSVLRFFKISHHGSRTGYDTNLLNYLMPNESIISCGQSNRFGHPHIPPWDQIDPRPKLTWKDGEDVYTYILN
jgi:beta-lactamase superfamily II metal-dependent hydrolase